MTADTARAQLLEQFGVAPTGSGAAIAIAVPLDRWHALGAFARQTLGCQFFNFLTAVDWKDQGVDVVLRVENLDAGFSVTVTTRMTGVVLECASLVDVYRGANWMERECYDMFGVRFIGHPDLRRILLPDDWEGHPLLKSYAVDTPHPPYR